MSLRTVKTKEMKATTEQIRMAELISKNDQIIDDPDFKAKIQIVMNITEKPEDIVATALYDAEWDTNVAVGILMEEEKGNSGWEETKKMGRKKASKTVIEEKKEPEVLENKTINTWEARPEVPPRMRRGGNNSETRGRRGPRLDNEKKSSSYENTNNSERIESNTNRYDRDRHDNGGVPRRGRGQGYRGGNNRRGSGRGGNRGGYRGRGRQGYEPTESKWNNNEQDVEQSEQPSVPNYETSLINTQLESDAYVVGYSGNIESWNPEHPVSNISEERLEQKSELSNPAKDLIEDAPSSWAQECTEADDSLEKVSSQDKHQSYEEVTRTESRNDIYRPPPLRQAEQPNKINSQIGYGAVENWNRKSPVTTSWDEEYTGSLADTKVFTASSTASRSKQALDTVHDSSHNRPSTESSINLQLPQFTRQKQPESNWLVNQKPAESNISSDNKLFESSAAVSRNDVRDRTISSEFRNSQATQTIHNQPHGSLQKDYNTADMKNELRNTQATQTVPNYPPGFQTDYNSPMNLATINKMLLTQGQSPVHQFQAPFPPQQTMSSSSWLSSVNLPQQGTGQHLNESNTRPTEATNIKITPKQESSANLYGSNTNAHGGKNVPTQYDMNSLPGTAGRSISSTLPAGYDTRQQSSHDSNRNLAQQLPKDAFNRSRFPLSSKIPDSAVEMPGGYSTRLDIQFGNLDLSSVQRNRTDLPVIPQPGNVAQSRYSGSFGHSSGQGSYAASPPTNPVINQLQKGIVTSVSSSSPPVRSQNHPSSNSGSQSGYVPAVPMPTSVMSQYFSPMKPNPSRQYGSVPTVSNNPNQYVGQIPPYGAWMDAQREQQFCYIDPNMINYLNAYGAYNCPN